MLPSRMFFNNLFDNMKEYDNVLKCDVLDNDDNYIFEFDVFGFNKDDINIDFEDGYLNVLVEKNSRDDNDKKYIRRERNVHTRYERSFYIGNIDEEKIAANFTDGILKISVPKNDKNIGKKNIMIED